jgi:hypothetical protein
MAHSIKESGLRMSNMVLGKRVGLMEPNMRGNMTKGGNMAEGN